MRRARELILVAATLALTVVIVSIVVRPLVTPVREGTPVPVCQSNMKEIALAFVMYMGENNDTMPSSAVCGSSDDTFRKTLGRMPPPPHGAKTIFQLLYPYKKNIDIMFCDKDPVAHKEVGFLWWKTRMPIPANLPASAPTSYVLKKAINDAWIDPKIKARTEKDINWPAEQLLFYERRSFHWGDTGGDLSDPKNRSKVGASINCAFIDGHVKVHRIPDMFEPDYYNVNGNTGAAVKKPQIDPRLYCDKLQ